MSKKESFRKTEIRYLIWMIVVTALIGIAALCFYITRDRSYFITYNEKSDIDYKVRLKENEFYEEDYLDKDKGYVATLIDEIKTNYRYSLSLPKNIEYKYSYRIVADVEVNDETVKSTIYHYSEDLLTEGLATNKGDLFIDENINIDYEKYNNVISKFKDVYELNNTSSNLNIILYVNIQDIDDSRTTHLMDRKVSSLTIPLTEKTIAIDISNDIINNTDNRIEITRTDNYNWVLLISAIFITIAIVYAIYLFIYARKTRTAQMIYEKEIKSILSNYDGYIQRISGTYDMGTSQVLKIESFTDMLEIRDTLKQPILMLENEAKDGTFFIIPATNSIIYTYSLRVVDIKAKMDEKEVPTYDITELPHTDFVKNKKYTDEFIKEQITKTSLMPTVDEANIIQGNKEPERDLYEQLEKTRNFDVREIRRAAQERARQEKEEKKLSAKEKKNRKNANKKKKHQVQ